MLLEEGFAMTSAFSWQNSISLCPASFCTPRPNLPVTTGISWLPLLPSNPLGCKTHLFFLMLVLEGLAGLYRTVQLQLLRLGHRLYGLLDFSLGVPGSSTCKESACNAGDPSLIPGLGRFPGEGISYRLQ